MSIVLAKLLIDARALNQYECNRKFSMGLYLDRFEKILNCANDDDALTITAQENADTATILIESPNHKKASS